MVRKIGNCADRFRAEQETYTHRSGRERIGRQAARHFNRGHHPGRIIIGLVGMAHMGADDQFTCRMGFCRPVGWINPVETRKPALGSTTKSTSITA